MTYAYTGGLLTKITDPHDRETILAYSGGQLESVTDFADRTATLDYDLDGRLIEVIEPDPDGAGPLEAPEVQYVYGPQGVIELIIDPLGRETAFEHDDIGRRTAAVDDLGNRTSYEYNNLHQIIKIMGKLRETLFQDTRQWGTRSRCRDSVGAHSSNLGTTEQMGVEIMVWKLFVLDKSPLVIDLVSVPAAQIRLNKRSWSEVHSIDMNTIFYDFVIDAARRITAIQLQIGPDHPVSEFVTSVSNMNYIEFCPCLRIWLSSARIGDECGLEAFGDLRLFRDCQATPALVMDPENWLPHSTV